MTQIVGTDNVKDSLLTNTNEAIESVDDAETGHADLDARLDAMDTAITAAISGSGCWVSTNDTTTGYLNGKLIAGEGIDFTENSDGGNETLTIAGEDATITNKGLVILPPLSAKTSDATLTAADLLTNAIFTNTGAAGAVNLTLPAGASGHRFIGIVTVAQYLKFTADGTEKFRYKAAQSAAGGYVRTNTVGNVIYGYWAGSEWILNIVGIWTYDE